MVQGGYFGYKIGPLPIQVAFAQVPREKNITRGRQIIQLRSNVEDRRLGVFLDHFGYFGRNIVPPVSLWWWVVQGGYFGYKIGSLPKGKSG